MPTVRRPETFNAVLLTSEALAVSDEQRFKIREILDIGASDSRFAQKMYDAIWHVLTSGAATPPVITSLSPSTAIIGSPDFTLHVIGTGFDLGSKIIFAGVEEPTTFVSETELTTGVMMSLWVGPDAVPVTVLGSNGVVSDPVDFTFTVALQTLSAGMGTKNKIGYPDKKLVVEEEHTQKGK